MLLYERRTGFFSRPSPLKLEKKIAIAPLGTSSRIPSLSALSGSLERSSLLGSNELISLTSSSTFPCDVLSEGAYIFSLSMLSIWFLTSVENCSTSSGSPAMAAVPITWPLKKMGNVEPGYHTPSFRAASSSSKLIFLYFMHGKEGG